MTCSVSLVHWSVFHPVCGTLVDSLRALLPEFHACVNFADNFSLCVHFLPHYVHLCRCVSLRVSDSCYVRGGVLRLRVCVRGRRIVLPRCVFLCSCVNFSDNFSLCVHF